MNEVNIPQMEKVFNMLPVSETVPAQNILPVQRVNSEDTPLTLNKFNVQEIVNQEEDE
jgi:hypothetical protein